MSSVDAWLSVGVVAAVFAVLALTRVAPYLAMLGGLAVLLVAGVLDSSEALAGFANEGMITVGLLFVVAAGVRQTGALSSVVYAILGQPRGARSAQARLAGPVAVVSAFLNNTPVVAMMLPAVRDWGRRIGVPASKLLIPLSYASILGGMCTLVGTSTFLVINGLILESGGPGLGMFEISLIGVPCAAVGLLYLVVAGDALLPRREEARHALDDPREYTMELVVGERGAMAGKTIGEAGLRNLPGAFLAEIHRGDQVIPAVAPSQSLEGGDQLVFVGLVESVVELQQRPGLEPATHQVFKLDAPRAERWFVEAVVSHQCPIVGNTIRDGAFRTHYNAVVIAVARGGERVDKKIGDIVLNAGDVLLLEAPPSFVDQHRNSNDFYLVGRATESQPTRDDRAWLAAAILTAMIGVVVAGWLSMFESALCAAGLMLLTRCCNEDTARRSVDWSVLLAIAGAFGLGRALLVSGAAESIASSLVGAAADNPRLAFAAVCLATTILAELVTHNAAAVIMFPIALQTAAGLGVDPMPFIIGLMIAAASACATPFGYQTNLMVYGPGGYHMTDFLRVGLPLDVLIFGVNVALTPLIWSF